MRIYTESNHTERNERERGERGKKQSVSRGDAGIMPSISGRAISSPSFVSGGREAGGRDFTSTRFAIPHLRHGTFIFMKRPGEPRK